MNQMARAMATAVAVGSVTSATTTPPHVPKLPTSYSPFGKKWDSAVPNKSVIPSTTTTAESTPVADPVQMSSFETASVSRTSSKMSNNPVLGGTAQPSYSAVALKPVNYSPFGKKWAPKRSSSSIAFAPTYGDSASDAGNSIALSSSTAQYSAPVTTAAKSKFKPATYSPFGKKWGPASNIVTPTTVVVASAVSVASYSAPVAAPKSKRATYSPYGKKWGPSKLVTQAAAVPVSVATATPTASFSAPVAPAAGSYGYIAPLATAAAAAAAKSAAKPVNYSPFGKKWAPVSSAPPVLIGSAPSASSTSERVSPNNYSIFGKKWRAFVRLYWARC
jgi:hypothetical protein